jgi:hypothetical protein
MTRLRSALGAAILLSLVAGCGATDHRPLPRAHLDVQQVAQDSTRFQREILADGNVTFAEYERSTLATIRCLEAAGFVVEGPFPRNGTDTRYLDFSYEARARAGETAESVARRLQADGNGCEQQFRSAVARVWEYQHLLTPAQREGQRTLLIACLRAGGLTIADDASEAEVVRVSFTRDNPAAAGCRKQFPDYYVTEANEQGR